MPRYIMRLDVGETPYYLEWSTVVDAPVTEGMTRIDFEEHYREQYGRHGMADFEGRMARADKKGVSSILGDSADGLIDGNRAGEGETTLTREQIIDHYVLGKPLAVGTTVGDDE